jgi:hypothetical protein
MGQAMFSEISRYLRTHLQNLDEQLAAGQISAHEYGVAVAEVLSAANPGSVQAICSLVRPDFLETLNIN